MDRALFRSIVPYAIGLAIAVALFIYADTFLYSPRPGQLGPGVWPRLAILLMGASCVYEIFRRLIAGNQDATGFLEAFDREPDIEEKQPVYPGLLVGGIVLDLDQLLRFAIEQGASDVHLKVGSRPRLRLDGRLREGPFDTAEPADTERIAAAVIPRSRAEAFASTGECDFMYAIAGLGRFRVSAFRQRGYVGLVLRRVLPASRASKRWDSRRRWPASPASSTVSSSSPGSLVRARRRRSRRWSTTSTSTGRVTS